MKTLKIAAATGLTVTESCGFVTTTAAPLSLPSSTPTAGRNPQGLPAIQNILDFSSPSLSK